MYAYIDSFRKFGKTNTDNQSIKIKRPYPVRERLSDFAGERGQKLTFAPTNQLRGSDGP